MKKHVLEFSSSMLFMTLQIQNMFGEEESIHKSWHSFPNNDW